MTKDFNAMDKSAKRPIEQSFLSEVYEDISDDSFKGFIDFDAAFLSAFV